MTHSDTISKSIKVKLKTELPYWLIIMPCVFLFGVLINKSFILNWPWMLGLTVVLLLFSILTYRLNSIKIDISKGEVTMTKNNLLGREKTKKYPLSNLQFAYKSGKVGLYSRTLNICTLYIG